MFRTRAFLAGLVVMACALTTAADTIYVNTDCGDDTWTGISPDCVAPDGPKATIQAGINAAVDGDTVEIACGTYTGDGNKNLDFDGKAITVRSTTGDPACVIIDCEADGRGFYFHSGEGPDSIVEGPTITNGSASPGGGVYCRYSSPTLINCTISENSADSSGGGVFCYFSSPTLTNCTISENSADDDGGGVLCRDGSPTLTNCTISENSADDDGGGVFCDDCSPMLTNCTISGNLAGDAGGGIYCDDSILTLTNCTISGNLAGDDGGGICCGYGAHLRLTSCILWGDLPDEIRYSEDTPVVQYCDVQGGWAGVGNINSDPLLAPDGHLTAGSPCINTGNPGGEYGEQTDRDGEPRVIGDRIDMGSDEWLDSDADGLPDWWEQLHFGDSLITDPLGDEDGDGASNLEEYEAGRNPWQAPRMYFVDLAGDDAWDGLAPEWDGEHGPKATIQAAIDACHSHEGDVVEIACGTYTGLGNKNLDFNGKAITVRSVTGDPECVIIDCESDGRGLYFHSGEGADSVVEGLMITGGSVSGDGGGVHCAASSPTLKNCTINGSSANYGGGVYCKLGAPTLTNCTVSRNSAGTNGGGVYCQLSAPTLTNCAVSGNSAGNYGGGVYCYWASDAVLTNCAIRRNSASRGGAVFCYDSSNPTLTNCTISGNSASDYGGGVYCSESSPTLTNCILWGDSPQEVYLYSGSLFVTFSDVQGGSGESWFGTGCIDTDPLLTPDGHLTVDSPCINVGDPDGEYSGQIDQDGESRIMGGRVDMGSDEWLDSDADGLPDWWEQLHFGDPLSADALGDEDGDGLTNLEEYAAGRNPWQAPRTCYVDLAGDDVWDGLAPQWDGEHGPKVTIQAAIDACDWFEGDEVEIACGTYTGLGNKNLDFAGKAIQVRSATGDPNCVTIDCEGDGRGFYFHSSEGLESIVEGLTIMNGSASFGGGVHCSDSSPTLTSCTITANSADEDGGGFYCYRGAAALVNCAISGNSASSGGGVCCDHGDATLDGCMVTGNSASFGGGVYCDSSNATLTGCMLSRNSASFGGGVYCDDGDAVLVNCTISGNAAGSGGGICHAFNTGSTLTNCTISRNLANQGGGVYCGQASSPTLFNCTIRGNVAEDQGGGICCLSQSHPRLTNCVLWGDLPQEVYRYDFASPFATFCDVQGGSGEFWFGTGCIDTDPLLTPDGHLTADSPCINAGDPDGEYSGQADQDGENRVMGGRVDMGPDEWLDSDADGLPDWWEQQHFSNPLIADPLGDEDGDGISNLDEYEASRNPWQAPRTYFVDLAGDDAWDGLAPQWNGEHGPKATVQAAIDACDQYERDEVEISCGTYTGLGNKNLDFQGKRITVRSAAGDPDCVIIDCEGDGRGFYFHSGEGPESVVEGLTVTNGSADWGGGVYCHANSCPTLTDNTISGNSANYGGGGGVYCGAHSAPTLANCTISGNSANTGGGGVYCDRSDPTLTNCTISGNLASSTGGGVYCGSGSDPTLTNSTISGNLAGGSGGGVSCANYTDVTLTDCTISGNSAGLDGGGVRCYRSNPTLTSCIISGNSASDDGGGAYYDDGDPILTNCTISGNSASSSGGGVYCYRGAASLVNCMISGNSASSGGGGVYCNFSDPTLTNCTISGNSAANGGGGVHCYNSSAPTLTNCILWDDTPSEINGWSGNVTVTYSDVQGGTGEPWFGTGCIDVDPLFADPDGPDNDPDTWEDNNYRLDSGSPCIDAGDNDALPADAFDLDGDGDVDEPLPIDLLGYDRRVDDPATIDTGNPGTVGPPVVDMGAYEYRLAGDMDCDGDIDFDDIDAFVLALSGQAGYEAAYPECNWLNADCNNDGLVDFDDIDAFVALLSGG